jgi:hypothetical protein
MARHAYYIKRVMTSHPGIHFIHLFFLSTATVFAQGSKTPLDKGFIEKTIEYYYTDQAKGHPNSLFFIERDSLVTKAKTIYPTFKVQFVTQEEATAKMLPTRKKASQLDKLTIKWISLDTIDVVIVGCTVGVKKVNEVINGKTMTRNVNFVSDCSEIQSEIPTCRFVYNGLNSSWTQVYEGKVLKKN